MEERGHRRDAVVVATFDREDDALAAVRALEGRGIPAQPIGAGNRPLDPDPLGAVPPPERRALEDALRRGATLVSARVQDPAVDETVALLRQHGAANAEEPTRTRPLHSTEEAVEIPPAHGRFEVRVYRGQEPEAALPREPFSGDRLGAVPDADPRAEPYSEDFAVDFRRRYAQGGAVFEDYAPAYRYGGELARDEQHRGRSWDELHPHAREGWEARRPGTWERFADAIRYGWERLTRGERP